MSLADKVKLEATARGWWGKPSIADKTRWAIAAHGRRFLVFAPGSIEPVEIDAPEALVILGLAALPPRVRRCPDCKTRGGPMEWCRRYLVSGIYTSDIWMHPDGTTTTTTRLNAPSDAQRDAASAEKHLHSKGWETTRVRDDVLIVAIHASRPCPTCSVPAEVECPGCEGVGYFGVGSRSSKLRLACKPCKGRGKVPATVECGACNGFGYFSVYDHDTHVPGPGFSNATRKDCSKCDGGRIPAPPVPTGRVATPWHEVMLAVTFSALGPGDPQDIADLHALADELMSPAHDPFDEARRSMADSKARCDLGLAVVLWLAGAPCGACEGTGKSKLARELATYFAKMVKEKVEMSPDTLDLVTFKVQRIVNEHGDGSTVTVDEDLEHRSYTIGGIDHDQRCDACAGHDTSLARHLAATKGDALAKPRKMPSPEDMHGACDGFGGEDAY